MGDKYSAKSGHTAATTQLYPVLSPEIGLQRGGRDRAEGEEMISARVRHRRPVPMPRLRPSWRRCPPGPQGHQAFKTSREAAA